MNYDFFKRCINTLSWTLFYLEIVFIWGFDLCIFINGANPELYFKTQFLILAVLVMYYFLKNIERSLEEPDDETNLKITLLFMLQIAVAAAVVGYTVFVLNTVPFRIQ